MRSTLYASLILFCLVGCFERPDVVWSQDTRVRVERFDAGTVGVSGVFEPEPITEYFEGGGELAEQSRTSVLQRLIFSGEIEPGVAIGFDLDGEDTQGAAEASCGHRDLVSPTGETGIDNNFALVWAFAEALIGEQVEALLQEAINEGRFLLLIELSGVDDMKADDDVTVTLSRGVLDPMVSSSGFLLPSQTYRVDDDFPASVVEGATLKDGVLRAGPLTFSVPIEIFDADFTLEFENGQLEVELAEDGSMVGIMGGSVDITKTLEELYNTGAGAEAELVTPLFESYADMYFADGACSGMSAAFRFEATSAFLLR